MPETPDEEEQTKVQTKVTPHDIAAARLTIWELNMILWGMAQDDTYLTDLIQGRNLDTTLKKGYSHAVRERMRMVEDRT